MDKHCNLHYNKKNQAMKTLNGQEDQRKKERIPFNKEIIINGNIKVNAIDISIGGIYLHTTHAFKRGELVKLTLPFKEESIDVAAKVKHTQSEVGMGLMFVDLDDIKINQIKELIAYTKRQPPRIRSSKPVILFVEDNETSRRMVKHKLISEGFWVIEAINGVEAIKILNEDSIDAILLDLYMEKMNGFKVLSIIKNSPKLADIPVVVYSAKGSDEIIDKVINAGADDFLLKMVSSPSKIAEVLRTLIDRRANPDN